MKKRMLAFCGCILLLFGCLAPAAAAQETDGQFGKYDHVFIIGVDGLGAMWETLDSPHFDRIFRQNGAYRYNAKTETVTISAQNWGAILTGTDADAHGMTNDSISEGTRTSDNPTPTIFRYVRRQFPDAQLASFTNWYPLNTGMIETDLNVEKYDAQNATDPAGDAYITESVVNYFNAGNAPKLFFVQLDEPDHFAHGNGADSAEYRQACETADTQMGRIFDAAVANGLMENGLFIVVADHGEIGYGHGGQSVQESSVVLGVVGRGINKCVLPEGVRNRDVAAIALHALGVEKPAHMTSAVPEGLFLPDGTQIPAHSYDEGVLVKAPTCTEQGEKRVTCFFCGESACLSIPATGHVDADQNGSCDVCAADLTGGTPDDSADFDWSSLFKPIRDFWARLIRLIRSLFRK